jgi:16S rRNA (guanine966-N2)-methyltransferase
VFVENGHKALRALDANIKSLGLGGKVQRITVRQFLQAIDTRFDLVFIDPPWPLSTEEVEKDLAELDDHLAVGGVVVTSRRHTDRVPTPPKTWRVATEKRYGDTRILKYQKESENT